MTGRGQEQGAQAEWARVHGPTCWRLHPLCALAAARDWHRARAAHHGGMAARLAGAGGAMARGGTPSDAHELLRHAQELLERVHEQAEARRRDREYLRDRRSS